jgi:hypothetical protein
VRPPPLDGERNGRCLALHQTGIRPETLKAFAGRWREDDAGNAVFPRDSWTRDGDGQRRKQAGVELTGSQGHRCTEDQRRGLWDSGERSGVRRIVVTERAVDALSYHQLNPRDDTRYLSTGGSALSAEQKSLVRDLASLGVTVIAAFGNTPEGLGLARALEASLPYGTAFERDAPPRLGGWNQTLQLKERDYIRAQGVRQRTRGLELER